MNKLLFLCLLIFCLWCFCKCETNQYDDDTKGRNVFGSIFGNKRPPLGDAASKSLCNTSCRCGERNEGGRIVGGVETDVNEFPWMVRLTYFRKFYCGGSLVNDKYVLTAAHCVKGFMWFMIKVTLGEHNRCNSTTQPETRFVIRAIASNFSFTSFQHDIALLRLNEKVPITDTIKPICLPSNDGNLFEYVNALATGWGTLSEEGKPSCTLQEVEVPIMTNAECKQTNYTKAMIADTMMCAGYPVGKKDSCQGDSGGPLSIERKHDKRYEIIGIISWGNGCARAGYPGVYTRVNKYLAWIYDNTNDGCFCKN